MAKRQTADKAAPAAPATAEKQGSLPAGASPAAAAPAAAQDKGQQPASAPASPGTPGADALAPGAGSTQQPIASEVPGAGAALELEKTGGTTGQEAQPNPSPIDAGAGSDDEVEALFIRAVPAQGFRRCGHRFTREGHGIALSLLSDEEIDALCSDPNLVVEHCSFPLKDVT
ncbi:hypothetical protein [Pseudomonas panipatensis]|uniref:hypothetical protein n=1 Tax=Pseudomonas panipatensis TaxID=428992 RepID=UPI0035B4B4A8